MAEFFRKIKENLEKKYAILGAFAEYRKRRRYIRRYETASAKFLKQKKQTSQLPPPLVDKNILGQEQCRKFPSMTTRYDYFIIWGHGLQYKNEIINMIKSHKDLKILKIMYHIPDTIDDLVMAIYSYDYAPFRHLKNKCKYLYDTPKKVLFIFVGNSSPNEDYFGKGVYRHIESLTIKELKEQMRDRFNPTVNGIRTEHHVIHASDSELQTHFILHYLGYGQGLDIFKKSSSILALPYYVRNYTEFTIRDIPLDSLLARPVTGKVLKKGKIHFIKQMTKIEDTPHYKALCGDKQKYQDYLDEYLGAPLTDYYNLDDFMKLADGFSYLAKPYEMNYIFAKKLNGSSYLLIDGTHRTAIMKYQGVKNLPVAILD